MCSMTSEAVTSPDELANAWPRLLARTEVVHLLARREVDTSPHREHGAESARNVRRPDRSLARNARIVSDAFLGDPEVPPPGLREQLCVDEEVVALDGDLLHRLYAHELECAVDVAHAQAKQRADEAVVAPRQKASKDRVVAIDAEPGDHVVVGHHRQEVLELRH